MVRIAITTGRADKDIPDELKEKLLREIVEIVDLAINNTKNPELAMAILIERLSYFRKQLQFEYNEKGELLEPYTLK